MYWDLYNNVSQFAFRDLSNIPLYPTIRSHPESYMLISLTALSHGGKCHRIPKSSHLGNIRLRSLCQIIEKEFVQTLTPPSPLITLRSIYHILGHLARQRAPWLTALRAISNRVPLRTHPQPAQVRKRAFVRRSRCTLGIRAEGRSSKGPPTPPTPTPPPLLNGNGNLIALPAASSEATDPASWIELWALIESAPTDHPDSDPILPPRSYQAFPTCTVLFADISRLDE
ncbi:hypothetical protein K449DRAFT_427577 [Hypoxylon sp. EC38]|nr:hypothetical protein K449DRAFT_427577 [Hypoxylon sp. EC38]